MMPIFSAATKIITHLGYFKGIPFSLQAFVEIRIRFPKIFHWNPPTLMTCMLLVEAHNGHTSCIHKIKAGFFRNERPPLNFSTHYGVQFSPLAYLGKGSCHELHPPLFPVSGLINIYFLTDPICWIIGNIPSFYTLEWA